MAGEEYRLFGASESEKIDQIKAQPDDTLFYLFSTKWTNPIDGKMKRYDEFVKIWWRENGAGYTYDLNDAGKYTKAQALGHATSSTTFPVPVAMVEVGGFGKVMRSVYN